MTANRLTAGQRAWLIVAVTAVVAGMTAGFWYSFQTLTAAAAHQGWNVPQLLPLMIDSGVPAYVIVDHLIVALGWRSRLPRLAAWGFAALTVVLNGAVPTGSTLLWRVAHAAMPVTWILGVETLRLLWRALGRNPQPHADRIPAGRWIAAPLPTLALWRRMTLLGVTSWETMCALEDTRVLVRDLHTAAGRPHAPAITRVVRTGRLPAALRQAAETGDPQHVETAAVEWVARQAALPDTVAAAVTGAAPRPEPAPGPGPEPGPAPQPEDTAPARTRARPAAKPRKGRVMTDEEVADLASAALGQVPVPSVNRIMDTAGVGRAKARRARDLLESNRITAIQ